MQLLYLYCCRVYVRRCVESSFTGDITKSVTLREVIAWASGIVLSGRRVFLFQSPLHGPDTQRSHVSQGAKVSIGNNSLWSLESHSQSLKTSVVNSTSCFEALFH